jgi:hypothetical protein
VAEDAVLTDRSTEVIPVGDELFGGTRGLGPDENLDESDDDEEDG